MRWIFGISELHGDRGRALNMKDFDAYLREQVDGFFRNGERRVSARLKEAVMYTLLSPGKRIRPRLVEASARLFHLKPEQYLPVSAAIEMFHAFSLIHDDLPCLDNDDMRRGKPSSHKAFGEAVALLAGDALLSLSIESLSKSFARVQPHWWHNGHKRFLRAIGPRGVIGGQAAELELGSEDTFEDVRSIHRQKTGALFEAAVLIPADFAGVPTNDASYIDLERFARTLGEAFQVMDDLEDVAQDASQVSRSIFHYRPMQEVLNELRTEAAATQKPLLNWGGDNARPLIDVAQEVLGRIDALEKSVLR